MQAIVFIPGTMGTELLAADGEVLWPPRLLETQFGYGRIDKLTRPDVKVGEIIRKVACVNFYQPVFDEFEQLGFTPGGAAKRLYALPYDWRVDLERTAGEFAALVERAHTDGATDIHLVAHSMGGLVARLVLESGRHDARPWFKALRSFTALAVPHRGAPLALARVLGLDSDLGISKADFRRLTGDARYPSGYQLLPAPGEDACWNQTVTGLDPLDIYDAATAARLGLNPALLARARWVHDTLGKGAVPSHVRYFFFAGTGHETVTRVNAFSDAAGGFPLERMVVTHSENSGDGTVPMWSALPRPGQKECVINDHSHVFTGKPFRAVFHRLLGGDLGPALQSLLEGRGTGGPANQIRLSMPRQVIVAGTPFELLVVPENPAGAIDGQLMLQRLDDAGAPAGVEEALAGVSYEGAPVSTLRLEMPALASRGLYQVRFDGTPAAPTPLRFAVVDFGA